MHVIKKKTLEDHGAEHGDVLDALRSWHQLVKREDWTTPADLKRRFPSASIINDERVVFNIKGNAYRLLAVVAYRQEGMKQGTVFIIRVMTHAEYDELDMKILSYEG